MKASKIFIIYGLTISLVLTLVSVSSAKDMQQMLLGFIYLPLVLYFGSRLINTNKKVVLKKRPKQEKALTTTNSIEPTVITPEEVPFGVTDNDKRVFLKLIGSAGFSLLLMALFTKKAQAAFFGSMPGPGTVAIKNSAGVKIDPAEAHPTDGYKITQIDDASTPAYYGFLKKNGYWYIMEESSSGGYRYAKGTTAFSTNWTNRASLTYDYFNSVFG